MDKHKSYRILISNFRKGNFDFFSKLYSYFERELDIWHASPRELREAGISTPKIEAFTSYRDEADKDKILNVHLEHNIKVLCIHDKNYPKRLKEICTAPFFLFAVGDVNILKKRTVAIVGSRKATDYGRRVTRELSSSLSKAGIVIVSGLALGLDTEAHSACLDAQGSTAAVLANGLDRIYPASNFLLAKRIIKQGGVILSEQPVCTPALRQNFPARNRIISGLSDGILITEAGDHSGTLHTASFAIDQNRQIFAVPGHIYSPSSIGPNRLIKMGAVPVTEAQDILEDLGLESPQPIPPKPENSLEETIFSILSNAPLHIDEITKNSSLSSSDISKVLTLMEIKNKVVHLGGMVYSLRK